MPLLPTSPRPICGLWFSENPDRLAAYKNFPALTLDIKSAETASPLVHVTSDDAATLLLAGDKDELVPISHSRKHPSSVPKSEGQEPAD